MSVSLLVLSLLVYGTAFAANDKAMNWCGWRTNTTFTTASPYVAKNLRDLDTFRNWFATDNPHGNDAGYWWNEGNMTSTRTGSWVNPNTWGTKILAQWNQGGCAYVDSIITNVCEIRFGADPERSLKTTG